MRLRGLYLTTCCKERKVSGFRCQGKAVLDTETLYEIPLAGIANRLDVEHRTSNIEYRILMTLLFIDFKTSEPHNTEPENFERL
jgi:hypothetical protein